MEPPDISRRIDLHTKNQQTYAGETRNITASVQPNRLQGEVDNAIRVRQTTKPIQDRLKQVQIQCIQNIPTLQAAWRPQMNQWQKSLAMINSFQGGLSATSNDKFLQMTYHGTNELQTTITNPAIGQCHDDFGLQYNLQINEGLSRQSTSTTANNYAYALGLNNEESDLISSSAHMFQWDSSGKESLTGLLMEQIRNSQEEIYSLSQEMQGSYTTMLLGPQLPQAPLNDMMSNLGRNSDYISSKNDYQVSLNDMSSTPGRNKDYIFSENHYQDNQLSNWGEGYLSEPEEEPWKNRIFEAMNLQEIEETTSAVQETSITLSDNTMQTENMASEEKKNAETNGSQELTEQEIDEFIAAEQVAASAGNNADINSKYTPQLGMEFKTKEAAQHFFNFYAYIAGFATAVVRVFRTGSKKKNQEITKITVKCNKYGQNKGPKTIEQQEAAGDSEIGKKKGPKRKTTVVEKTDCKCVMVAKEVGQVWKIIRLDLDHNHELQPGKHFNGRKYLTEMEKTLIRTLNESNIPTRKMVSILSNIRGGPTALPVKKKDISNMRTKINREVRGSDMTKLLDSFRNRKADDPSFFYKFVLDEDNRVKNIFWRHGSSLKYYEEYGDCVSFDTTYMTNKYRLPFAPFVGITGHAQTCLFGCAFIQDETTETFKWVFETFLESMGGKQPRSIITDQDKAMKAAIPEVFPRTRHRNCLFHIKNKCYTKNLKVFAKHKGLYETFEDTVNNCISESEFEYLWIKMIEDKELQNNKYFTRMWETRERFIPVYYKHDFFPFIQTTSRSEAINARFKENVGPTYSINSFFAEYQRMIETIDRAENEEDHYSVQKRQKDLMFGYTFEIQAQKLYNRNIYKKFQIQLKATSTLACKEIEDGKEFEVWQRRNQVQTQERIRKYTVKTDIIEGGGEFSCVCAKFDKDGILCSHILKVMIEKEINEIPDKYIIDRWRKKELRMLKQTIEEETIQTSSLLRFNMLSRASTVLNSKASKKKQATEYLMSEMQRIDLELEKLLASETASTSRDEVLSHEQELIAEATNAALSDEENVIEDPETTTKRGRPELPKRMKPLIEEVREKMKQKENKKKKKVTANEGKGSPVKPKPKRMKRTAKNNDAGDKNATTKS